MSGWGERVLLVSGGGRERVLRVNGGGGREERSGEGRKEGKGWWG